MAPFISPNAVARYEPLIHSKLAVASSRIEGYRQPGEPLELRLCFWYLFADIITSLVLLSGMGLLDSPMLDPGYHKFATGGQRLFQ